MTTYMLVTGTYDSEWPICRLTEDQAAILRLTDLTLPDDAKVVELPDPPPALVIEPTGTIARIGVTIAWDGTVPGSAANLNDGSELLVDHRCRLTAGDIVLEPEPCPTELTVKRWKLDLDYKPMVTLVVIGPDPVEVGVRFALERALIDSDPIAAVLEVWAADSGAAQQVHSRLGYFLGRPENTGLAAAVATGRYDSILGR